MNDGLGGRPFGASVELWVNGSDARMSLVETDRQRAHDRAGLPPLVKPDLMAR